MTHSGDIKSGAAGNQDDETILVDVDKLAGSVKCIMFVASAYSGGTFKNVETARAELRVVATDGTKRTVCRFNCGGAGDKTSLIMCCLRRGQQYGTWMATEIN